ncbi:MAG TPA: hypothetical protein VKD70_03655 [Candidatus Acidoferrum sp.]|nr:hypothetical protein [Candidatus Acidoferrum sp.]
MADSTSGSGSGTTAPSNERRLESWGEIASYLRREIRTVQRWERNLGLPIHRLSVGKNSSVYAYPSELDKWYKERETQLPKEDHESDVAVPPEHGDSTPGPNEPVNGQTAQPPPATDESAGARRKFSRKRLIAGAALVFAVGLLTAKYGSQLPDTIFPPKVSFPIRLLVRSFNSPAGQPNSDIDAEGFTAELISQLSKVDAARLVVIAPTSALQLRDKTLSELRGTYRVQYVLDGHLQRIGNQIHLVVFLISTSDGAYVWTASFDGDTPNILKVLNEVAVQAGRKILPALSTSNLSSPPVQIDPAGYRAYLQGRKSWAARDIGHSVQEYEQAVALLANYSMAHSGLASAYALLGQAPNDGVPATVSAPRAVAEARRALALNPNNAEAHYVLGNIAMHYDWDFPTAERELEEAIRLEQNNPTAHQWLGQYYMVTNRIPEAQAETSIALNIDPVSPIYTVARAEAFYYAHDYDATIATSNTILEQAPRFVLAEFWLGAAYREKRMYQESLQHFRNAINMLPDNPALLMAYGHALAVSGDTAGAHGLLSQLQTLSRHRYVPAIYMAGIYTGLGDKDSAFHWLDKAVREHNDRLIYLKMDPIADPLRSDPRFQLLMAYVRVP